MGENVHDLGQDGTRTTAHYDISHELLYTSRDVVFLPSDATSGWTVVYVLVVYSALPKMSPFFYSTVDKATANERLAHEV